MIELVAIVAFIIACRHMHYKFEIEDHGDGLSITAK
jgi:hypothetical protein